MHDTDRELLMRAARAADVAKDATQFAAELNARNTALGLDVLDMREVMRRMIAGIDHLAEIARQWEPDHSSGWDRRGWALAKDARDDAERLLTKQAERILAATLAGADGGSIPATDQKE